MSIIRVRARFFALYRDFAGAEELSLELPAACSAAHALAALRARGGGLELLPERPVIAVNPAFETLEFVLRDGDELAFLPPVAGG